jgi:uncharacterized membrane protein
MQFRHHRSSLAKTLSFAVIHLALAVAIGWLLTGAFVFGALLAFIEPVVNTATMHQLDKLFRPGARTRRDALLKSGLLGISHFVVAMGVGWALTGSLAVATAYALIEPAANAVAHYFFERWWERRAPRPQAV